MAHVRHGDAELLMENGFKQSPEIPTMEWSRGKGDYIFFVQLQKEGWLLIISKFGANGIGRVEQCLYETYGSLEQALNKCDEFTQEEINHE